VHQGEHRGIPHRDTIDVGHRKRKPGTLQQRSDLAYVRKRSNARRTPPSISDSAAAKLWRSSRSVSPQGRRQQQPIRL
jgi:hypothetical protein